MAERPPVSDGGDEPPIADDLRLTRLRMQGLIDQMAAGVARIDALGLTGVIRPLATNCRDHEGSRYARVHTWDGSKWNFTSDWFESDAQIIKPMIKEFANRYAAEKKITRRSCEAEMAAAVKAAPAAAPAAAPTKAAPPAKAAAPAAKK